MSCIANMKYTAFCGSCFRYFHTTTSVFRSEKVMRKLLGGSGKKKHHYNNTNILPTLDGLGKHSSEGKKSGSRKRMWVLNKLFMRYITDLMATGQSASELLGHGIEVNKVKVTPDYNTIRVYWISRGTKQDGDVEELLQKNAGIIRHELSELRVMGVVPKIAFVKDKEHAEVMEIDARLARADFGEDHIPTDLASKLKSKLELYTNIDHETQTRIETADETTVEFDESPLPVMTQDILGLNHADILLRVKKLMKKSEALHRLSSNKDGLEGTMEANVNMNPLTYPDSKSERAAFKEFLIKRQLMQSKMKDKDKNYTPDIEYMREELEEKCTSYNNTLLEVEEKESETDYIIDDEENNDVK